MEIIEQLPQFRSRFKNWNGRENLAGYPFIENVHAPLTPLRRALPMLNLGLISSAGGYIDGTEPFDTQAAGGDASVREIPIEVEAEDIKYAAKGYDAAAVIADRNAQVPIDRLREYEENAVIGRLNEVWWSLSSYTPDAAAIAETAVPHIVERLKRYSVNAALLVPATRLCHQTLGIIARGIEDSGISTVMIAVETAIPLMVRPPRTTYYDGEIGSVAGKPGWPQYQRRILDETLRSMETFDQPGVRKLVVELETAVETARGER